MNTELFHTEGFIKMHRKVLESPIWQNINDWRLASTILLYANWKENRVLTRNAGVIVVPRGGMLTCLDSLAQKSGLSRMATRTSLAHLEKLDFLTRTITHHFTVIKVNNYSKYQDRDFQSSTRSNTELTQSQHRYKKGEERKENNNKAFDDNGWTALREKVKATKQRLEQRRQEEQRGLDR